MAVFGGALYAWLHGIPHVWHVREIISASPRLSNVFRLLARLFAHRLICNSKETMRWISTPATRDRCTVVWNGVETANSKGRRDVERARVGFLPTDVVFALVGRINAWKGQALLVDAFELLRKEGFTGIKLWIVGAAFAGQEHYEAALQSRINGSPFGADMVFEGFRADIDAVWEGADVVTVPSTEPEPFGRVAIEAMAFQLPVIAAAHGGLIDIVEHGVSGLLFEPCKPAALAAAMRELLVDPVRRQTMGAAAKRRQQEVFSVESYAMQVQEILRTTARQTGKVVA
jgi:glycosyltransferase involved in cell wall biosynthesis